MKKAKISTQKTPKFRHEKGENFNPTKGKMHSLPEI